jgi:hypothetical protein
MNHIAAKAVATILLSTLALLGIAPNAQAQSSCSNASLSGSFGYTNTGTIVTPPSVFLLELVGRPLTGKATRRPPPP